MNLTSFKYSLCGISGFRYYRISGKKPTLQFMGNNHLLKAALCGQFYKSLNPFGDIQYKTIFYFFVISFSSAFCNFRISNLNQAMFTIFSY